MGGEPGARHTDLACEETDRPVASGFLVKTPERLPDLGMSQGSEPARADGWLGP